MKTINNFIVEQLEYSTFPINEKLKISSRSKIYNYFPKDKFELRKILKERLAEDKNADLNDIDVSEITDMGYNGFLNNTGLFEDLDPHNIDISKWDVSKIKYMSGMFYKCYNFNCDLSKWDVSNVMTMNQMFDWCEKFNCDLSKWNVSNVTNMFGMFEHCSSFKGKGLENWKVSKGTNMDYMFLNCDSLIINKPSWYEG